MDRSTKESWLQGSGDLEEADVEDVPAKGESVRVRGLSAKFSAEIQSHAKLAQVGNEQVMTVDQATIERITFLHGVVEPKFDDREVGIVQEKFGPAFKKVVGEINRLSGIQDDAVERTEATFPDSGAVANGGGSGGPVPPAAVEAPGGPVG